MISHYFWISVSLMEASISSATVLVTFGVLLGKLSPLQLLLVTLVELPLSTANNFLGYRIFRVSDVGK